MPPSTLDDIAAAITRQAQRQGFVVARDIRTELKLAGLPEDQWKEVAALAKGELNYRQGRYYHLATVSPRLQKAQQQQRIIQKAIRQVRNIIAPRSSKVNAAGRIALISSSRSRSTPRMAKCSLS